MNTNIDIDIEELYLREVDNKIYDVMLGALDEFLGDEDVTFINGAVTMYQHLYSKEYYIDSVITIINGLKAVISMMDSDIESYMIDACNIAIERIEALLEEYEEKLLNI